MKNFLFLSLLALTFAFPAHAESTYDRVMKAGKIRCGYASWPPVLFVDTKTQEVKGLIPDMMEEIGKKLGLEIEWAEEAGWTNIIEGVKTHRYDMACTGLYTKAERAKHISFSTPYFYMPMHAVLRADETRFKKYEDFNNPDVKISIVDGEAGAITAQQKFPRAQLISLANGSDYTLVYEDVKAKKADMSLVEMASFNEFQKNNPGILKIMDIKKPLGVFPVAYALPKDDPDFKAIIDAAISELNSEGTLESIILKYEETPNTYLMVAKPYEVRP